MAGHRVGGPDRPGSGTPPDARTETAADTSDGRLFSPSCARNRGPLAEALPSALAGLAGMLLEIGSGSGEHAVALAPCLPDLVWQPSDPDRAHRISIAAWTAHSGVAGVQPPLALDAAGDWPAHPAAAARLPLAAVFSANVIHIAPWAVAEGIVAGAGRALTPGGRLVFYGPFMRGGAHTGDGNVRFDAQLKARDPRFGIRDLDALTALAAAAGFGGPGVVTMPADNRLVVFQRR
ncbi:MAG: DUF938 domain-containing protein [Pseudomonadota bacterium]